MEMGKEKEQKESMKKVSMDTAVVAKCELELDSLGFKEYIEKRDNPEDMTSSSYRIWHYRDRINEYNVTFNGETNIWELFAHSVRDPEYYDCAYVAKPEGPDIKGFFGGFREKFLNRKKFANKRKK